MFTVIYLSVIFIITFYFKIYNIENTLISQNYSLLKRGSIGHGSCWLFYHFLVFVVFLTHFRFNSLFYLTVYRNSITFFAQVLLIPLCMHNIEMKLCLTTGENTSLIRLFMTTRDKGLKYYEIVLTEMENQITTADSSFTLLIHFYITICTSTNSRMVRISSLKLFW